MLLVLIFIAWPLADIGLVRRPFLSMLLVIVVLSGILTLGSSGRFALPTILLGCLLFVLRAISVIAPSNRLSLSIEGVASLFVLLLCIVLLKGVFGTGRISVHRIVGAIVVYFLIALLFAMFFDAIERLSPQAFTAAPEQPGLAPAGARFFYLSMITLPTVGFGDMTPVHPFARSLVMLEALCGQIYTAVLLAWLVSLEVAHHCRSSAMEDVSQHRPADRR